MKRFLISLRIYLFENTFRTLFVYDIASYEQWFGSWGLGHDGCAFPDSLLLFNCVAYIDIAK
jgi:hypothetical protein